MSEQGVGAFSAHPRTEGRWGYDRSGPGCATQRKPGLRLAIVVLLCWVVYYAAYLSSSLVHHGLGPWLAAATFGGRFEGFHLEPSGYGYALAQLPAEAGRFAQACFFGAGLAVQVLLGVLIGLAAPARLPRGLRLVLLLSGWVLATRGLEKTLWASVFGGPNVDMLLWSVGGPPTLRWVLAVSAGLGWIAVELAGLRRLGRVIPLGDEFRRRDVRIAVMLLALGTPVWAMAVAFPYRQVYFTGGYRPAVILGIAHGAALLVCGWPGRRDDSFAQESGEQGP